MATKNVTGKVRRLFPSAGGLDIRYMNMAEGYLSLRKNHPNYDTLASVAIVAAVNRYTLQIWTEEGSTDVVYLVVDWND